MVKGEADKSKVTVLSAAKLLTEANSVAPSKSLRSLTSPVAIEPIIWNFILESLMFWLAVVNWNLIASKPVVPGSTMAALVRPVKVNLPKSVTLAMVIRLPEIGKVPLTATASVVTSVAATTWKPMVLPALVFLLRSNLTEIFFSPSTVKRPAGSEKVTTPKEKEVISANLVLPSYR
ncbi:MAG: hypothetical protein DDT18_02007 [Actinobacteria bacterium]|nr:hypothetical protein [Actinomycetota bacterium]